VQALELKDQAERGELLAEEMKAAFERIGRE